MANGNFNNANRGFPRRPQFEDRRQPPPEVKAEPLPADYVDKADEVMRRIAAERFRITTSKIRNLYSLVSDIYNVENLRDESELLPESVTALTMARIRMVYEAGREPSVKDFIKNARLLEYMKDVKTDRKKLIDFAHYMEALVAYHRFYIGGREG